MQGESLRRNETPIGRHRNWVIAIMPSCVDKDVDVDATTTRLVHPLRFVWWVGVVGVVGMVGGGKLP